MKKSKELYIFISHAWYNDTLYGELKNMLDEMFERGWNDLSIPRNRGLNLMSSGERALFEEIEIQGRLIQTARNERAKLSEQAENLEKEAKEKQKQLESEAKAEKEAKEKRIEEQRKLTEAIVAEEALNLKGLEADFKEIDRERRLESRIENCIARIKELTEIGAGDRQVKSEKDYREVLMAELRSRNLLEMEQRSRHIEELISHSKSRKNSALSRIQDLDEEHANLASHIDKKSQEQPMHPILERFQRLDIEIRDRQERIAILSEESFPQLYNVNRRINPLLQSVKGNIELATRYPTLSLAIYERIRNADIVLVIAGMYDQYRSWMEFEFAIAADRRKPIVAVLPKGQKDKPTELRYFVTDIVDWNCHNIQDAIQAALEG